jgi:hypothetical protein
MLYLVGYKHLNSDNPLTKNNCSIFISRRSFITLNYASMRNESIICQLIQDFDFSESIDINNSLNLFLIHVNSKIQNNITKPIKNIVSDYAFNIAYNRINNITIKHKKYIKNVANIEINYNDLLNRNLATKKSWLSMFDCEYKYPYKQLLYLYFDTDDNINLPGIPIEIIDIICWFLNIKFEIDFNSFYTDDNRVILTTPSFLISKDNIKNITNY